jgi:phosphoglycolate phosphatase-like HAD superfamily hydrolase
VKYVLFWDIDGTLLTTARAGIFAWEEACLKVLGKAVDLSNFYTAGLTDVEIAERLAEANGVKPEPSVILDFLRFYESALPSCLPRKAGAVLPGVREVLDHLQGERDIISLLLTGNTAAGAKAKLVYYGLDRYFTCGAFAEIGLDRAMIARKAMEIAKRILQDDLFMEGIYVIGDTPHDIHCGKAIGARTIAVGSSIYPVEELLKHKPWWAIERLPKPEVFVRKIRS